MWSAIYKEIFKTKKRKQFPINRYQSYTCFGETELMGIFDIINS